MDTDFLARIGKRIADLPIRILCFARMLLEVWGTMLTWSYVWLPIYYLAFRSRDELSYENFALGVFSIAALVTTAALCSIPFQLLSGGLPPKKWQYEIPLAKEDWEKTFVRSVLWAGPIFLVIFSLFHFYMRKLL